MRLIDADMLPKYTGTALSAVDVAMAVENTPTIDPIKYGEWILCSERLPESYKRVLLTCLWKGNRYTDMATFSKDGKVWHTFMQFGDVGNIEPIAWMPVPDPYKSERGEDEL